MQLFLGVDTSNYTTSLCLVKDGKVIASIRRLLDVKPGSSGLRQSDAVFLHTKALPCLSKELFESVKDYSSSDLTAVGVSSKPRDAKDSYMPCFLAGVSYASAISHALSIPLYTFSHQAGHIKAALYTCDFEPGLNEKFISFHISGGTTEALLTTKTSVSYECEIVGGTNDASAGQMIDRAGVALNLQFPCGKALDYISKNSTKKLPLCVSSNGTYFSMSGLENKVQKYLDDGENPSDIALFLFESIAKSLEKCLVSLRDKYGNLPVVFAGGVMSNTIIRNRLSKLDNVYFATPEYSTDNACGTALLTYDNYNIGVNI